MYKEIIGNWISRKQRYEKMFKSNKPDSLNTFKLQKKAQDTSDMIRVHPHAHH